MSMLVAQWRDAERRLYPLVLSAPELYEYSLNLVRAVVDELGAVGSVEELAERFDQRGQLIAQVASNAGVGGVGQLDTEAVAGAAFAMRYAQLENDASRAAALDRVAAARRVGQTWATLYESGLTMASGAVMPPYHRLDACLMQPWGLHSSAEFDMDANVVVYRIEVTRVDVDTARWWADEAPPVAERTHDTVESWQASLAELRAVLLDTRAL